MAPAEDSVALAVEQLLNSIAVVSVFIDPAASPADGTVAVNTKPLCRQFLSQFVGGSAGFFDISAAVKAVFIFSFESVNASPLRWRNVGSKGRTANTSSAAATMGSFMVCASCRRG